MSTVTEDPAADKRVPACTKLNRAFAHIISSLTASPWFNSHSVFAEYRMEILKERDVPSRRWLSGIVRHYLRFLGGLRGRSLTKLDNLRSLGGSAASRSERNYLVNWLLSDLLIFRWIGYAAGRL